MDDSNNPDSLDESKGSGCLNREKSDACIWGIPQVQLGIWKIPQIQLGIWEISQIPWRICRWFIFNYKKFLKCLHIWEISQIPRDLGNSPNFQSFWKISKILEIYDPQIPWGNLGKFLGEFPKYLGIWRIAQMPGNLGIWGWV